jgi:hypothetical protein
VLYDLSLKEYGRGHIIYFRSNKHFPHLEELLNSRTLTALSYDSNDHTYRSPRHFLIGAPVTSFPETNLSNVSLWCCG